MGGPSKHALIFIFFTVLIDTIAFGIVMPVLPKLLVALTGDTVEQVTFLAGWLLAIYAGLQFIFGPVIGNLSDRYGRRPVLLGALAAFTIEYFLMGFAPAVSWLFAGYIVAGITGAVYSPSMAYIADASPPAQRAQAFGLVGAAFGLGFIVGAAIGGLLGEVGPRAPFFAAAALAGLNFLYGVFVLPESLPEDKRRKFEWKRANVFGTFIAFKHYPAVIGLASAVFLWNLGYQVYPSTWSFYLQIQLGWSPAAIGISFAYVGVLLIFTQAYLLGKIVPSIGEFWAVILGAASGVTSMLIMAFASAGWFVYLAITVGVLQGIAHPSMNAIMSRQAPPDQQGELQGGIASLLALAAVIGPLVMTQVLGRFSAQDAPIHFPGAAFVLAAVLSLISLGLIARAGRKLTTERVPVSEAAE